jgi:hypothetical protein
MQEQKRNVVVFRMHWAPAVSAFKVLRAESSEVLVRLYKMCRARLVQCSLRTTIKDPDHARSVLHVRPR